MASGLFNTTGSDSCTSTVSYKGQYACAKLGIPLYHTFKVIAPAFGAILILFGMIMILFGYKFYQPLAAGIVGVTVGFILFMVCKNLFLFGKSNSF